MFEGIISFFKKFGKGEVQDAKSKDTAKERLHLVLMQDRANVSADFLEMMKQEIIDVIKKYITVDESEIDVRLTNKTNEDGTSGAPALYANIPIVSIKNENKNTVKDLKDSDNKEKSNKEEKIEKGSKKSVTKKEESAKKDEEINEESKKIEKKQDSKDEKESEDDSKERLSEPENSKKETEKKDEKDSNKKNITSKKTSTKKVTKKTTTKKNA